MAVEQERSLADLTEIVDSTPDVGEPEGFDLGAFIAGVRPTRRSVKLYGRADLVGVLEQLAERIDALPDGPEVDGLIAEAERAQAAFLASGVWFTVEKRSSEWVERFRTDTAARLGVSAETPEGRIALLLHQLAAQIVAPAGVTYAHLRALMDTNEGELNKLVVALTAANEQLADRARAVTLDFSQRRSGQMAAPSEN